MPIRDEKGKFIPSNQGQNAASSSVSPSSKSQTSSKKGFLPSLPKFGLNTTTFVVVVVVILAIAAAGFYYQQYQGSQAELESIKSDPKKIARLEAKELVKQVGQLVALPQGEDPTVATVTDVSKLKDQPFFANAQNGDKVLIYTQARKAYLYRPNINKVLEIAPVNIGNSGQTATPSAKP